jgi:hypothetical protein
MSSLTWRMKSQHRWYQHIGIQWGDGDWHACSFNLCDHPLITRFDVLVDGGGSSCATRVTCMETSRQPRDEGNIVTSSNSFVISHVILQT